MSAKLLSVKACAKLVKSAPTLEIPLGRGALPLKLFFPNSFSFGVFCPNKFRSESERPQKKVPERGSGEVPERGSGEVPERGSGARFRSEEVLERFRSKVPARFQKVVSCPDPTSSNAGPPIAGAVHAEGAHLVDVPAGVV